MLAYRKTLAVLAVVVVLVVLVTPAPSEAQRGGEQVEEKDYYATLGLKRDCTAAEIKRAYRKLSLQYHPDKNPGNAEAARRDMEINEANDVLSSEDKRNVYDIHGVRGVREMEKQAAGGGGGGGNPLAEMFGFGGGGGGGGVRRGPDFRVRLEVTLEELYNGAQRQVSLQRKVVCPKCRGTGAKGGETQQCQKCHGRGVVMTMQQLGPGFNVQMQTQCDACGGTGRSHKHKCPHCGGAKQVQEEKVLEASIERGMADGAELRFERASEQAPGQIPGDVILQLAQAPHARFRRNGNDLAMTMSITLREALLGFSRSFVHLDGRSVKVARKNTVTYPGEVMRLVGEGMPHHEVPSQLGDMLVTFDIIFPSVLSDSQRAEIRKLLQ